MCRSVVRAKSRRVVAEHGAPAGNLVPDHLAGIFDIAGRARRRRNFEALSSPSSPAAAIPGTSVTSTTSVASGRTTTRTPETTTRRPTANSLAVLALVAARDTLPAKAATALQSRQCGDGGLPRGSCLFGSNVGSTALALAALTAAGVGTSDPVVGKATAYLRNAQNGDGGFGDAAGGATMAEPTGVVINALNGMGADPTAPEWRKASGANPVTALTALQDTSGGLRPGCRKSGRLDDNGASSSRSRRRSLPDPARAQGGADHDNGDLAGRRIAHVDDHDPARPLDDSRRGDDGGIGDTRDDDVDTNRSGRARRPQRQWRERSLAGDTASLRRHAVRGRRGRDRAPPASAHLNSHLLHRPIGSGSPSASLHSLTWALWAVAAATTIQLAPSPVYVALVIVIAALVVSAHGLATPWARAFPVLVGVGVAFGILRVVLTAATTHGGSPVVASLPSFTLPRILGGFTMGGDVSLPVVLQAAAESFAIVGIMAAFGAFNAVVSHHELIKVVPRRVL